MRVYHVSVVNEAAQLVVERQLLKTLYKSLAPLSSRIDIQGCIQIDNYNDLASLFHPKLKQFYFSTITSMELNLNDNVDGSSKLKNQNMQLSQLQDICYRMRMLGSEYLNRFNQIISHLDQFSLRYHVKTYRFEWMVYDIKYSWPFGDFLFMHDNEKHVFNTFFLPDKLKHPYVEQIVVHIRDNKFLHYGASIFLYLSNNRQRLCHLKSIQIEWRAIKNPCADLCHDKTHVNLPNVTADRRIVRNIFGVLYETKKNHVQFFDCNLRIKPFGLLYQQLVWWFQKIGVDNIGGHGIRLHVNLNAQSNSMTYTSKQPEECLTMTNVL